MNLSSNIKADERNEWLENSTAISHSILKESIPANPEPVNISTEKKTVVDEEAQHDPAVKIHLSDDGKQFSINSEINPLDMSASIPFPNNNELYQNMEVLRKRYLNEVHNRDGTKDDTNVFRAFAVACKERFYEMLTRITFNGQNCYANHLSDKRSIPFEDFKNTFVYLRKIEELRRRENEDKIDEKNRLKENPLIGYRDFGIASLVLGGIRTNCVERTKIKPSIRNIAKNAYMKKFKEIIPRT